MALFDEEEEREGFCRDVDAVVDEVGIFGFLL
jgi:hypothetical protein